ncbi:FMN-binding protein [Streptomyces sp. NPDC002580]|uniref:FMN-binding protein n=1 Tax=Streptomyces sp. NPDC002580 TaxID=3364653 RepID=UPI0036A82F29
MRRAAVATSGISALVVALLALKPHQLPAPGGTSRTPSSASSSSSTSSGTSSGSSTRTGTFTGDPVDTRYGTVQVAATLVKGRITAVKVLRAPDQNGRDQEIAAYSLPRLTQEAIGAQSARIDAVSGATYTSQGYTRSLQSALDQARA